MPSIEAHHGAYLLYVGRETQLIQTDWDWPATAALFGWSIRRVQANKDGTARELKRAPNRGHGCDHKGTDGTVRCPDCGLDASDFITAAGNFLDDLC